MLKIRNSVGKPDPTLASAYISKWTNYDVNRRDTRPIAIKDNIATLKFPTTCASPILRNHQSPFAATVIGKLSGKAKLSDIVGKTNMDEFGMGSHSTNSFFGPVSNADSFPQHSVGGSSGGSAVAVVAGSCSSALGTDTGGSVRLPAAYTGIVGFKPSYGLVSRWGVIPYANSLDTVGVLAPNVELVQSDFEIVNKYSSKDPTSLTRKSRQRIAKHLIQHYAQASQRILETGEADKAFKNMKVGVPLEYNISELDPDIRAAWMEALQHLQDKGATIVPISLPNTKHALSAYYVLAPAEAASNLSKYDGVRYGTRSDSRDGEGDVLYSNTRGSGFGNEVKRRILLGSYTLSSEAIDNYFIKAQKIRRLVQRDFDRVFRIPNPLRPAEQFDLSSMDESIELENKLGPAQVDIIVCPTAPTRPPTREQVSEQTAVDTYMTDVFTVPASLAGLPAISLPMLIPGEHRKEGSPNFAGIQLIGQFSDDRRLLWWARAFEKLPGFRGAVDRLPVFNDSTSSPDNSWILPVQTNTWRAMKKQRKAKNTLVAEKSTSTETLKDSSAAQGKPNAMTHAHFFKIFTAWKESEGFRKCNTYHQGKRDLQKFLKLHDRSQTIEEKAEKKPEQIKESEEIDGSEQLERLLRSMYGGKD
ncbi:hypothetical protein VTL71DRAFT_6631 [Oculimacula yallundae]|uniref:Glutamyl-tRNA(Gln) amidotransferase subunit A, mitochondrial n=1 Tax=Oculimacula yallundae TaxID=86028 RepID=A0ABR4BXH3_9HELO